MTFTGANLTLNLSSDWQRIASLSDGERELACAMQKPIFTLGMRKKAGEAYCLDAIDVLRVDVEAGENHAAITYLLKDLSVTVTLHGGDALRWKVQVVNHSQDVVEYIDFPSVNYDGELENASVLWPYNEGVLVEDGSKKREMLEPLFPSMGKYGMFPYMVFAQFTAYLYDGKGVYMGIEDAGRAPKGIDFCCHDGQTEFRTRLFTGGEFGGDVNLSYEIVWKSFQGDWQDGADLYKAWFEKHLPKELAPVGQRTSLPAWYREDMPIVVTYPVRGIHDMDEMNPNGLFPYLNAMPTVERIADHTDSKILVILMHWEGTAPWAPPYVWPPYGGVEVFNEFMDALHEKGHLLGVYCSGSSFTKQSNLIKEYDMTDTIRERELHKGFCIAPDQSVQLSRICVGQRSGYDICTASQVGYDMMNEAVEPLLRSGVDYVQAMDQNHGGNMYFCYAQDHGHPPVPGQWMTDATLKMFEHWREVEPNTLLGCESAAAEPFLAALGISDNRYELNLVYGRLVPLYSYLYHPYLHNFMGNQVSCSLEDTTIGLNYRIAYSFLAGDLITLVINDAGEIVFYWGMRDFSQKVDTNQVLDLVAELQTWHKKYPWIFRDGNMVKPMGYTCREHEFALKRAPWSYTDRAVLSTAWVESTDADTMVQIFVNYTDEEQTCCLENGENLVLAPRSSEAMRICR